MLRRGGGESVASGRDTQAPPADREPRSDVPSSLTSEETVDARLGDRVAELERALVLAKGEQDSLKEELEKTRSQAEAEQDTIEDLRHQLAETHQNAESAPRHVSSEHGRDNWPSDRPDEEIFRQNYELRYRIVQLQEQLSAQDAQYRERAERSPSSHGESEWNELRSRLHATEKESQERLQQLLSLKSSISSLTRVDSQVTDSELTVSFSQLANCVREWVITNFRRSKLDLDGIPPETVQALMSIAPDYALVTSTDRLALYQAIVSSALMQVFEEPIFVGIPRTGPLVAVRECAMIIRDTGAEAQYGEWRRATIRALESSEARHTIATEQESLLYRLAEDIQRLLFTLTSVSLASSAQSALVGILSNAADLQHTLALQKAAYQVLFFRRQAAEKVHIDDQRMESVNDLDSTVDEDGDTQTERNFLFCVFPCLEKHGDEWGEHPETSNVLLKARVCCGVG